MSAEQSYQQTKHVADLPPELTKLIPEPGPEPEPLPGSEQEPELLPGSEQETEHHHQVTQEPENPPQEEIEEHQEKKDLSSQPPPPEAEPVLQLEETQLESTAGDEGEPLQQAEKDPKEPPTLHRGFSQETLKPEHPATKEDDGHLLDQPLPPPLAEQRHQQKKPPT